MARDDRISERRRGPDLDQNPGLTAVVGLPETRGDLADLGTTFQKIETEPIGTLPEIGVAEGGAAEGDQGANRGADPGVAVVSCDQKQIKNKTAGICKTKTL